jgi:A/G-specific adenine glycosylase
MKSNVIELGEFFHKNKFIPLILHWFKKNQRNLYWRRNRDLYLTYLSEIMLQQTTVKTVENKILEIINIFPSFNSFKNKKLEQLLKVWSGLGYYNRAVNLFKAVKIINNKFNGVLPDNKDSLISLPGVGTYTSSAILAIGHNQKAFPIDVNVKRLVERISGTELKDKEVESILSLACKKKISYRSLAESMMDFSSIICKKNNPDCDKCKFSNFCKSAFQKFENNQNTKKINKKIDFYILNSPLHICFIKKPKFQFYKNFIHLPSNLDEEFISNIKLKKKEKIKSFKFVITNNLFQVNVYKLNQKKLKIANTVWIEKIKTKELALPTLFKKILN